MRWRRTSATLAATLLALSVAMACSDGDVDDLARRATADRGDASRADAIDGPVAGADGMPLVAERDEVEVATLVVTDGTDSLRVTTGDLGDDLYRISAADGSGIVPRVVATAPPGPAGDVPGDGEGAGHVVEVHTEAAGTGGPAALLVEVNAAVRWTLRLSGGGSEALVDASAGGLEHLDVVAGLTRLETWLAPTGAPVTVTETGGASQVVAHAPPDVPVRVEAHGGAGSIEVDGAVRSGVAAGTIVAPPGWEATAGRIELVLIGGVSSVVVDRAG